MRRKLVVSSVNQSQQLKHSLPEKDVSKKALLSVIP